MLVAKTQEAFEFLKKQFQDREVGKTYHAIVVGEMKTEKGK
jgi:23S rRNA-/tRNA-specific pseudouridylate synthase